jgi:hypothetical protein
MCKGTCSRYQAPLYILEVDIKMVRNVVKYAAFLLFGQEMPAHAVELN